MLAEAILADRLGFNPDPSLSRDFMRDVVSRLEPEFELTGDRVDQWALDHLVHSSRRERRGRV